MISRGIFFWFRGLPRVQSVQVSRTQWRLAWAGLALTAVGGISIWSGRVRKPPAPPPASLPASARSLLLPFHKDNFDLSVGPHGDLDYRVGMQAGATLVYAWSTGHSGSMVACECPGQPTARASEAHVGFEARSSGWYHWRWKNPSGRPVTIHLKLSGYYEPAIVPAAGMPYDR